MGVFSKILGAGQDKLIKQYAKQVDKINAMEPEIKEMSSEQIEAELAAIRSAIEAGENATDYTNRVFALGRESIFRATGKRAYDVQLIGAMALNDGHIAEMATGEGKAVILKTAIPTPEGWRKAGEIKIGDRVFGPDGKPTTITGVYPQGKKEVFEVELKDGRIIECAEDHLWSVYSSYHKGKMKTLTTGEMIKQGAKAFQGKEYRGYKFHLPTSKAVEYSEKNLSLDPYVMGLMLGDGCRNDAGNFKVSCSIEDRANVDYIAESIGAVYHCKEDKNFIWNFYSKYNGKGRGKGNVRIKISDVAPKYEELLSNVYCHEKWIPEEYKLGSIEQRWALVQGLMDSDGNIYGKNNGRYNMQFSTTSEKLRDDFMEVIYSLGLSCNWRCSRKAGVRTAKHDQYTITFSVPNELKANFFRLERKKSVAIEARNKVKKRDYERIAIKDIRKTGRFEEQVCFTVDHPDHLFLVGNYVVTHNTLTSNFAILMNVIAGKQVHVVTVNEYLSGRDADLCRQSLEGTGVSVGYIYNQQPKESKKEAYACDVVYGTPSEFGFDYLRDNMVVDINDKVQKKHDYAIIDEIDSILIDEARTPLIISGAGSNDVAIYKAFALAVQGLRQGVHFEMDEAKKTISATEKGLQMVEKQLGIDDLYSQEYNQLPRYFKQALTAQFLYHRDKDYIVQNGEVKIVDPNTGRIMEGRRWSEGLHQAIEAKERVEIQQENDTLATVTLQNFFRLYDKLSGCTGTAMTEDAEFRKTYGMGVVAVPTARPVIRQDMPDVVYKSVKAKFEAIADKIAELNANNQPVLVGTVSVENSERLSKLLTQRGIKHFTLNAKNHEKEAHIVAQAGRAGAVTIATNMAGRGTDIILGGNPDEMLESYKAAILAQRTPDSETGKIDDFIPQAELDEAMRQIKEICKKEQEMVLEAGGLAVIGSERHESRRIDNQLRGRSGRQGDPGYSQFYISLEDDLMRLFGQERMEAIKHFMDKAELEDDVPLDAPMISKAIERAQRQVESMHFESRKHTLEYDDVLNKQRLAIYAERDMLLGQDDVDMKLDDLESSVADDLAYEYCPPSAPPEDWEYEKLMVAYAYLAGGRITDVRFLQQGSPGMDSTEGVAHTILWHLRDEYDSKEKVLGKENMTNIAKRVMLTSVDDAWKDHLNYMDYLKSGIGLRSYGQRDPLIEYKDEAYKAFEFMVDNMYQSALTSIMSMAVDAIPAHQARQDERNVIADASNLAAERQVAIPGAKKAPTGAAPIAASQSENQVFAPAHTDSGAVAAVADESVPVIAAGGMGTSAYEENAGLGDADFIDNTENQK